MARMNVNISDEVYKAFKMKCLEKGKTVTETIHFLVENWTSEKLVHTSTLKKQPVMEKKSVSPVADQSWVAADKLSESDEVQKQIEESYSIKLSSEKEDTLNELYPKK